MGRTYHRELCDIGRKGHLTKDEFSVALMLMKIRKEGQHLPSTLPPGLLPASTPSHEDDAYDGIARDHSVCPFLAYMMLYIVLTT